jgi:hypothetical protein
VRPAVVAFAVSIDFTNYDIDPPSVQFIDLCSSKPLTTKEISVKFFQVVQTNPPIPNFPFVANAINPILVGEPDEFPFLCIPGVREYHNHPSHTGNPWLLYRTKGEGTLAFLIDQLYNHSIPFIRGFGVNMTVILNQS